MTAEADIAAIEDGGANTAAEVRTALTSVLNAGSPLATKPTTDTPDDDFDSPTLDGKWTVVAGSSGTVDLLAGSVGVVEVYDLTTRPGTLLLQVGTDDELLLRQDYTLPDGASMILAVAGAPGGGVQGDNMSLGLFLNQTDSDAQAGEWIALALEQDNAEYCVQAYSSTSAAGTEVDARSMLLGERIFLRIMRDGLDYHAFVSLDGRTWVWVHTETESAAHTNVWIRFAGPTTATPAPVAAVDWIRQGTNDVDPW